MTVGLPGCKDYRYFNHGSKRHGFIIFYKSMFSGRNNGAINIEILIYSVLLFKYLKISRNLRSWKHINMGTNTKKRKSNYFGIYDKLTGIYNRAYFEETFQSLDKAENLPISVVICDLNFLKLINDLFGHRGGDKLLVDTANLLKNQCRHCDIIGRWGSDEFILVLPKTDYKTTMQIVSRIKNNSKELECMGFPINISLGAATKIEISTSIEEIIKSADDLMYRNKLLESKELHYPIVDFLEKIMSDKHYQTREHTERLKKIVRKIGSFLGLSDKELEELSMVAALHDIGKISIPLEILNKPGFLTRDE